MSFLCTLPLISSLLTTCLPPLPLASGYVEGEYVLMAPVETAQIDQVTVRRGDRITAGQELVLLEKRDAEISVAQASASLKQAESNLSNISQGRRPEEIAVIEASVASAKAQVNEARRELKRQQDLLARGITPQAAFDQAQAQAALENAEWRLSKRTLTAVSAGIIFDVIRSQGEVAGPQAPVLSILPDGAVKLRLYIPETAISQISLGTKLVVDCDGCADTTAEVSYVSSGPEFTPPVIYSLENRQKLVYLIEARPSKGSTALKPGQIVNLDLASGTK